MGATLEQRFWGKVKTSGGCWLWTGAGGRYGYIRPPGGNPEGAHRVSWELAHGPIPSGRWVLHRCDVPRCVRPEHLYLGSASDNAEAGVVSNRIRRAPDGIGLGTISVRLPHALMMSLRQMAEREQTTVSNIVRRALTAEGKLSHN